MAAIRRNLAGQMAQETASEIGAGMPNLEFCLTIAIGAVLGFGAALVIFLPILWRQTELEDARDAAREERKLLLATLDRVRVNLDALSGRRDRSIFEAVKTEKNAITAPTGANKGIKNGGC
jgi:hypothetical protein